MTSFQPPSPGSSCEPNSQIITSEMLLESMMVNLKKSSMSHNITLVFSDGLTVCLPRRLLPGSFEYENSVLRLAEFSGRDFQKILDYLYSGEFPSVTPGECQLWLRFYQIAEYFGLTLMKLESERRLMDCLSRHASLDCPLQLFNTLHSLGVRTSSHLQREINRAFLRTLKDSLYSVSLLTISKESLVKLLSICKGRSSCCDVSEIDLFQFLVRWCVCTVFCVRQTVCLTFQQSIKIFRVMSPLDQELAREMISEFLPFINFCNVSCEQFKQSVFAALPMLKEEMRFQIASDVIQGEEQRRLLSAKSSSSIALFGRLTSWMHFLPINLFYQRLAEQMPGLPIRVLCLTATELFSGLVHAADVTSVDI